MRDATIATMARMVRYVYWQIVLSLYLSLLICCTYALELLSRVTFLTILYRTTESHKRDSSAFRNEFVSRRCFHLKRRVDTFGSANGHVVGQEQLTIRA